ncbi:hypothetical protein QC761_0059770 [Podospora bellae-mahoneyi]|uniref:SprT-like domain-containing protein n=1 Tax=Podospora bellae-mahoneyi TaxID=2093777 RepID=A0ABR0FP75_9PEZI|nr:hypothetical protein QC761_0059770 [Podospora bellae-mahoneyi]
MRVDFPFVYLSIIQGEGEAVRVKDPHWRNDLTKWQPKAAGPLYLHRHIINNMIACLRKPDEARENYKVFKFQMAITVAHEIVHFLTGLLIDPIPRRQYTPPRVTLEIYGDRAKGEAGRFFEKMLLGGVLECYEDPTDRLGDQQAGEPWVFPDSKNSSVGHRVSMAYIHRFINKGLLCPPTAHPGLSARSRFVQRFSGPAPSSGTRSSPSGAGQVNRAPAPRTSYSGTPPHASHPRPSYVSYPAPDQARGSYISGDRYIHQYQRSSEGAN